MRLVLDDGKEIPLGNIKVLEVKENHRIILKTENEEMNQSILSVKEMLEHFFAPSKILVIPKEVNIEIVKNE